MTRTTRLAGVVLAGVFLALHLPFLPASLEDLDSINFALGVRDYNVAQHQPHPPGYPIFIAGAKLLHAAGLSEVKALALLAVVSGALGVYALTALCSRLQGDRQGPLTWATVVLAAANPLYWITAARPLSDLSGLAASLAVQGLALAARTPTQFAMVCGVAGLAAGIRSQVVWLTLPLLGLMLCRLAAPLRLRAAWTGGLSYAGGALLWFVPLLVVSGGPAAYFAALSAQGAEDLSGVTMLATTPTARQLARSLEYALIAPWGSPVLGIAVVALSLAGVWRWWRSSRSALWAVVLAFGPYLLFDLLFQETVTTRYALPIVVPVSVLAVAALAALPDVVAVAATLALAAWGASIGDGVIARYARPEAPVFRMIGDWASAAAQSAPFRPPVLAMHRREAFDLRRPLQWRASQLPTFDRRLPSTAKHEWLDVVQYWNDGGTAPVWFVADPLRSDLALIRTAARPVRYRWGFEPTILLGGSRPSQMDWYVLESPDWYLGEGWALTPETAGLADEDRRGPGLAPIEGWIRRTDGPLTLMVGGRNISPDGSSSQLAVELDGHRIDSTAVPPGFFLQTLHVPGLRGEGAYARIRVSAERAGVAIEQFDAQPDGRVMFGFAEGWNEQEYNPETGAVWRWSSDRSVLRVRASGRALALTLRGEIEEASRSHVTVRVGERRLAEFDVDKTFERTVVLPADAFSSAETDLVIESSAWYVPAETRWRSTDRRRLGLKLLDCRLSPAS